MGYGDHSKSGGAIVPGQIVGFLIVANFAFISLMFDLILMACFSISINRVPWVLVVPLDPQVPL